jgi:segregation and condensation protein B
MCAKARMLQKEPSASIDLSTFRQPPATTGLSLDQLSASLAGMMASGDNPYEQAPEPEVNAEPVEVEPVSSAEEEICPISPRSILEAMLFVGSPNNQSLTSSQVAGLMRGVRPAEIDELVRQLNDDYRRRGCPYTIAAEGAGYRMRICERFGSLRDRFYGRARAARLSQAAIDVLAIVAYHAPISAEEVNRLRGKPSGSILLQLVRRQLLRVERDSQKPRQMRYNPTPRFLALFGLTSLDELPRSKELEQA